MEQKPTVYTNRKDFLLDMYKYILHAVLEETSDTGAKKTTSNSVIHKLVKSHVIIHSCIIFMHFLAL